MSSKKKSKATADNRGKKRLIHDVEGSGSGALAGAVLGAAAGPVGIAVGAVLGGVAGALAGDVLDKDASKRAAHTKDLDEQIGVGGGDLGAPGLLHPPAQVGAYSSASAGGQSEAESEPAEGPMQVPND